MFENFELTELDIIMNQYKTDITYEMIEMIRVMILARKIKVLIDKQNKDKNPFIIKKITDRLKEYKELIKLYKELKIIKNPSYRIINNYIKKLKDMFPQKENIKEIKYIYYILESKYDNYEDEDEDEYEDNLPPPPALRLERVETCMCNDNDEDACRICMKNTLYTILNHFKLYPLLPEYRLYLDLNPYASIDDLILYYEKFKNTYISPHEIVDTKLDRLINKIIVYNRRYMDSINDIYIPEIDNTKLLLIDIIYGGNIYNSIINDHVFPKIINTHDSVESILSEFKVTSARSTPSSKTTNLSKLQIINLINKYRPRNNVVLKNLQEQKLYLESLISEMKRKNPVLTYITLCNRTSQDLVDIITRNVDLSLIIFNLKDVIENVQVDICRH
jgi:hypothetical protein